MLTSSTKSLNSYSVHMFYSWFGALFTAFVDGFVGLPVINISYLMPTAVLVRGS